MTVSTEMSVERQARAKEYAGVRRRLYFARTVATLIVLALLVVTPFAKAVRTAIEHRAANQWLVVLVFVLIFGLVSEIVTFPLGVYSGWHLPRRYGLSHQSFASWVADLAKGSVIGGALGMGMVELLYWGLRRLPDWWWLAGGAIYLLFSVVLSNLAPVLIMPLFNTFTPIEDVTLRERMLHLAERAGTRVRGVFTMDFSRRTSAANAFVTGIGSTRRIVLGDTLIANYTPEEVEVVMAHELGHHVHGDIWHGMAFDTAVTLIGLFIANLLLHMGVGAFGYRSVGDVAAFPLFALILSGFGLVTMPLTNAYSRARERAADAYALTLTGNAPAFVTAMQRLANQNLAEMEPPHWVVLLFYSHPPLADRVRQGETFANISPLPFREGVGG
ncbi:MAG: M48 family metallopeptidase [Chloroflexota bacterium]|nr:M48 family metallopeptidase [Chloroflexota bacterium]